MFAQIPQTHSFQRTYSSVHPGAPHPTTSRKNVNKENAHGSGLPSKTPSRPGPSNNGGPLKMAPTTAVRQGLGVKTVERNAANRGKVEDIEPKRLFQASGKSLPPSKSLSSMPHILATRVTRTPGPSRVMPPSTSRANLRTPAPSRAVFAEPTPAPLPSAQRARRSSSRLSASTSSPGEGGMVMDLRTPAPRARWEEEASLDHITEGVEGLEMTDEGVEVEDDDDWEVEYMPPTAQEPNHEPMWSQPDLKAAFNTMSKAPPLWRIHEDAPIMPPSPKLEMAEEPSFLPIPVDNDDLEEPMFRRAAAPKPDPAALRPVAQKNVSKAVGQTNASKSGIKPALKAPIRGTVASARPVVRPVARNLSSQPKSTSGIRTNSTAAPVRGVSGSTLKPQPPRTQVQSAPVRAAPLREPPPTLDDGLDLVPLDLDDKLFDI